MTERLDPWVSATIRDEIERRFYAKINEQADLVRLVNDPEFMAAPDRHVGLFSDHGVVHARDIANQDLMCSQAATASSFRGEIRNDLP